MVFWYHKISQRFQNFSPVFFCFLQLENNAGNNDVPLSLFTPSLEFPLISCLCLGTRLLSRTPSALRNGPRHTIIMANICSPLFTLRQHSNDETIQICLDKLYALANPPKLPRSVLKDLLVFATKRSHFVFDGQYYDQIDGVAMGSPLGPVLANIVMCDFEEKWVMNNGARPTIWFRYVDDTFTLFNNKNTAV